MDNPKLLVPLKLGWVREVVYRSNHRKRADIYYRSPGNEKARTASDLQTKNLLSGGLTLENFSFTGIPIGVNDPTKEIIRRASEQKPSRLSTSQVSKSERPKPLQVPAEKKEKRKASQKSLPGDYLAPFKFGWKRELVHRSSAQSSKQVDVYYISPCGRKTRSKIDVQKLIGPELSKDNFTFLAKPVGGGEHELFRFANQSKKRDHNPTEKCKKYRNCQCRLHASQCGNGYLPDYRSSSTSLAPSDTLSSTSHLDESSTSSAKLATPATDSGQRSKSDDPAQTNGHCNEQILNAADRKMKSRPRRPRKFNDRVTVVGKRPSIQLKASLSEPELYLFEGDQQRGQKQPTQKPDSKQKHFVKPVEIETESLPNSAMMYDRLGSSSPFACKVLAVKVNRDHSILPRSASSSSNSKAVHKNHLAHEQLTPDVPALLGGCEIDSGGPRNSSLLKSSIKSKTEVLTKRPKDGVPKRPQGRPRKLGGVNEIEERDTNHPRTGERSQTEKSLSGGRQSRKGALDPLEDPESSIQLTTQVAASVPKDFRGVPIRPPGRSPNSDEASAAEDIKQLDTSTPKHSKLANSSLERQRPLKSAFHSSEKLKSSKPSTTDVPVKRSKDSGDVPKRPRGRPRKSGGISATSAIGQCGAEHSCSSGNSDNLKYSLKCQQYLKPSVEEDSKSAKQPTTQAPVTEPNDSRQTTTTPKRPPGRPRKSGTIRATSAHSSTEEHSKLANSSFERRRSIKRALDPLIKLESSKPPSTDVPVKRSKDSGDVLKRPPGRPRKSDGICATSANTGKNSKSKGQQFVKRTPNISVTKPEGYQSPKRSEEKLKYSSTSPNRYVPQRPRGRRRKLSAFLERSANGQFARSTVEISGTAPEHCLLLVKIEDTPSITSPSNPTAGYSIPDQDIGAPEDDTLMKDHPIDQKFALGLKDDCDNLESPCGLPRKSFKADEVHDTSSVLLKGSESSPERQQSPATSIRNSSNDNNETVHVPKRPRGRPRKSATAAGNQIDKCNIQSVKVERSEPSPEPNASPVIEHCLPRHNRTSSVDCHGSEGLDEGSTSSDDGPSPSSSSAVQPPSPHHARLRASVHSNSTDEKLISDCGTERIFRHSAKRKREKNLIFFGPKNRPGRPRKFSLPTDLTSPSSAQLSDESMQEEIMAPECKDMAVQTDEVSFSLGNFFFDPTF